MIFLVNAQLQLLRAQSKVIYLVKFSLFSKHIVIFNIFGACVYKTYLTSLRVFCS